MRNSRNPRTHNEAKLEKDAVSGLPRIIKDAVLEIEKNVQVPLDIVIASALGAMSLACQNKIEVQRGPNKLTAPCSLFFITIAESGDRKSSVDYFFTDPIFQFEKERRKNYEREEIIYNSRLEVWNEKRKEIKFQIRKACREGVECESLENKLIALDQEKPVRPKKIKMIYKDATPESIIYGLHQDWPSAGIISDEAGGILNGRAMNDLGMLNQIWDGSSLNVDRRNSESFTLNNARLTISLMTQEKSLRKFLERNDGMARDIGFIARCLVSYPRSIQGNRPIEYPSIQNSVNFEKIEKFKERLVFILNDNLDLKSPGLILNLSSEAQYLWVDFFNEVEMKLKPGKELESVKDAASKIADNAARMAGIFYYFENGEGEICANSMKGAISICNLYLNNFKKLFGEYGLLSPERNDVNKLVDWLILKKRGGELQTSMKKNYIRQNGPIRNSYQLDKVIQFLNNEGIVGLRNYEGTEMVFLIEENDFSHLVKM